MAENYLYRQRNSGNPPHVDCKTCVSENPRSALSLNSTVPIFLHYITIVSSHSSNS
ncbi:unnamed protein product [Penicillium salamii]|nr:unnamed protein product [Penicillium salamii]